MSIRLGCAVWAHKGWVGTLYPPKTPATAFLRHYSAHVATVEGNATFYAVPSAATVLKWASETPEQFRFCCKIPKDISHAGDLRNTIPQTDAFLERMAPLGQRLGPFFLQLPPRFAPRHLPQLAAWLAAWPRSQRVAVEVRHPDWYREPARAALRELLDRHGAGHCIMDVRPLTAAPLPGQEHDLDTARDHKPDLPLDAWVSGNLALVRYISHPDTPVNQPYLTEWAAQLQQWHRAGVDVFFFVHCPDEDRSPAHLALLQAAVGENTPQTDGLLPLEQQASLF